MFAALTLATVFSTAAVEGTVVQKESRWQDGLIVTDTTLRVERVLEGQAPRHVQVRQLGGSIDGIGQVVFGEEELPAAAVGDLVKANLVLEGTTWRVAGTHAHAHGHAYKAGEGGEEAAAQAVRATTAINRSCGDGEPIALHWPSETTKYAIDQNSFDGMRASDVQSAVHAAFDAWADVSCSYFKLEYEGEIGDASVGYRSSGGNKNVVTWVEKGWEGKSTTQAVTVLTFGCQDGVIVDADILVNADDFDFTTDPENDAENKRDLQNVLTHEAGHFVGFGHSPDPSSTMYATVKADETQKRDLTDNDVSGMCEAYPVERGPLEEEETVPGCSIGAAGSGSSPGGVVAGMMALAFCAACALKSRRRRPKHVLGR